jgi:hypothetical protein
MTQLSILTMTTLLCVAVLGTTNANAADFRFSGIEVPSCDKLRGESICIALSLTGKIELGDTAKLLRQVELAESSISKSIAPARVALLFLESPGGSMSEAMALGRLIRGRQISTQVAKGDTCASSCVLILAGGVKRVPAGNIVIHSFYSPEILGTNDFAKAEKLYTQVANEVSAYLKDVRISSLLLDEMMRIPHVKSRQLELEELIKLGLLGIDPVYAQARSNPPSSAFTSDKK